MTNTLSVQSGQCRADEDAAVAQLKSELSKATGPSHVRGPLRRCADAFLRIKEREAETAGREVIGFLGTAIPGIVNRLVADRKDILAGMTEGARSAVLRGTVVEEFDDEPCGVEVTVYEQQQDGSQQLGGPEVRYWNGTVCLLEEFCPDDVLFDLQMDPENTRLLIQDLTTHLQAQLIKLARERDAVFTIEAAFTPDERDTTDSPNVVEAQREGPVTEQAIKALDESDKAAESPQAQNVLCPVEWSEVTITFWNDREINIRCGGANHNVSFRALRLMDLRKRKAGLEEPTIPWLWLCDIARSEAKLAGFVPPSEGRGSVSKQIGELNKALNVWLEKELNLRPSGNPVKHLPGRGYHALFTVELGPEFTR